MDDNTKTTLTPTELDALRDQLKAAISGGASMDSYADALFHDNSNCSDGHGSHSQSGAHSSHCDKDGWI